MKNPDELGQGPFVPGARQTPSFAPDIRIDFGALLARMLRNWYWFVLAVAIAVALAWLNLRYATPVYESRASVLIQEQSGGQGGLSTQALAAELGVENSYVIDNEIHMLRSNFLMERVVELLRLDIEYEHQGKVRNTEIYQPAAYTLVPMDTVIRTLDNPIKYGSVMVRFSDRESFLLVRGENDSIPHAYGEPFQIGNRDFKLVLSEDKPINNTVDLFAIRAMNPASVAGRYRGALSVSQVERSGVVNMTLTDPVPQKGRDILNAVVQEYNRQIVEQQSLTGGQTLRFIEERLDFVTDELKAIESELSRFKRNANLTVDIGTQGADYLAQMNAFDAQQSELVVRRELIEDIRKRLTGSGSTYETLPIASQIISGFLSELIVEYNRTIFERSQQLESVTALHPKIATFDETLNNLKESILLSINSVLQETNKQIARVEERIRPLEARMSNIPTEAQGLLEIERQQAIKQELYMFLLTKREESALTIAAQVPNTRTIDRATSSSVPISPNPPITYLMAIGVGLFLPAGAMFLRELLSKSITTEQEATEYLPYSIVGRVVKTPKHGTLVVDKSSRSGIAEAFRLLRTNLGFLLPNEQTSVILVTSSVSGEGKSFISSNLGAALALTKKRVVVVGTDMRKPKLAEMILPEGNTDIKSKGLSSYLIGKATYEEAILPTAQENLFAIPSGPLPPNPAELLMEDRMGTLIKRLKQDFDIILLDAPPVGIVTDGLLLKDYVNLTLFVVRLGVTPKKSMSYITDMVETGRLPRFNLIVNGINPRDSYGYGYGYYE